MDKIKIAIMILLGLLVIMLSPMFYNKHLSPLSRFYRTLHVGDKYDDVYNKANIYVNDHGGPKVIGFGYGYDNYHCPSTDNLIIKPNKHISMLHDGIFDDLQIHICFDNNDKIKWKDFIGD